MPRLGHKRRIRTLLRLLITKLRRDLQRLDMNIVIGRISDYAIDNPERKRS